MPIADPDTRQQDLELLGQPPLASQFPLTFASGARFIHFACRCPNCQQLLMAEQLHGRLTRDGERAIAIDAVAICPACLTFTGAACRLHDDGRITGDGADGTGLTWHARLVRSSWLAMLRAWCNRWRGG